MILLISLVCLFVYMGIGFGFIAPSRMTKALERKGAYNKKRWPSLYDGMHPEYPAGGIGDLERMEAYIEAVCYALIWPVMVPLIGMIIAGQKWIDYARPDTSWEKDERIKALELHIKRLEKECEIGI